MKRVNLSEIPFDANLDEYSPNTIFVLDEEDENDWDNMNCSPALETPKSKSILDKFIDKCITSLPKCTFCKNFIDDGNDNEMKCKAFPHGIPDEVLWEDEETECNNEIKFEEE